MRGTRYICQIITVHTVQYSTVYNTIQYNTVYNTIQHSKQYNALCAVTSNQPLSASPWTPRYLRLLRPLWNLGAERGSITLMSSSASTLTTIRNIRANTSGTSQDFISALINQIKYYWNSAKPQVSSSGVQDCTMNKRTSACGLEIVGKQF